LAQVGLFGLIAIQFRAELGTILMRLPKSSPRFKTDSAVQLDLEIVVKRSLSEGAAPRAYSGVPKMR